MSERAKGKRVSFREGGSEERRGEEPERSCLTCWSHCSNINHGFHGRLMPLLRDKPKLWPDFGGSWTASPPLLPLLLLLEARLRLRV